MKIRIHRGARQIGGTCVEIEQDGVRIALDLGLPLDGDATDASLMPDIDPDGLVCVLISHPHIDHYGLLHHLPAGIPVAMGRSSRKIIEAAAPFTKQCLPALSGPELLDRQTFSIGPFSITPFLVDHSAFDAHALLVEAEGKRLFYSGDFRAHGRKAALFERLVATPPKDIDVLLMEGSSLSRLSSDMDFPTEQALESMLVSRLRKTAGLTMAQVSAQNIDRVVTLYRAAMRTGRTLVVDLYAAAILEATLHESIPKSNWEGVALYVPEYQRRQIKRLEMFDLLKTHSAHRIFIEDLQALAKRALLLFRPAMMADLETANCLANAHFIYGQWEGYLTRGDCALLPSWLERQSVPLEHMHTSGHASPRDLKRFAQAFAPKFLVPIHSFAPDAYPSMFANVVAHNDGEWWTV
jgi:ribonuclease J